MGAWSDVQNVIDNSNRDIKVLAGDTELGKKECQSMNIPEQSLLGSVVCNTQGILVDNWIRILLFLPAPKKGSLCKKNSAKR